MSGAARGLFRPDPARVDRGGLECSDLSPLTSVDAREGVLCGVSLAALVLSVEERGRRAREEVLGSLRDT